MMKNVKLIFQSSPAGILSICLDPETHGNLPSVNINRRIISLFLQINYFICLL